jgi:acetyl-CoA C-acetyltransferase
LIDPRAPVVVGAAQLLQRPDDISTAREPLALMIDVARAAAVDAAGHGLERSIGVIAAVKGAWSYRDPARAVADALDAPAKTVLTTDGGQTPQQLVNLFAEQIAAGQLDTALIVGAETIWSRRRMRTAGIDRPVTEQDASVAPDEMVGSELELATELEKARGLQLPIHFYPLFESAIRHRRGETLDEHRRRVAAMWAGFNEVAVRNPFAWSRKPMNANDIRTPTPDNRMVAFPYTKAMCSNWDLDQAAAVLLCSAETAEAHGVPRDRWVFVHAGTEANDTPAVSARRDLGRSPAIAAAWRALSADRHIGIDDIAHVDVYSCFPSAVQAATEAIGIDEARQLTVTGGLTFAGGPLNNYVSHSIATMTQVLRDDPGALALVTANGGHLTKHALGVYSTEPPSTPFRRHVLTPDLEPRADAVEHTGDATIDAVTVLHGHDGPQQALFALLTDDGRRTWGNSTNADVMAAAESTELIGTAATLDGNGAVHL